MEAGAQAAALDHPLRSRLLLACAHRERSLSDLARLLGQPLSKLHHHLGRLTGCGLLQVSRVEPRPGRPIRYYRAAAEAFLLNLADVAEPVGEKWSRELRRSLGEERNRREMSLLYHGDEAGRIRVQLVDAEGLGRTSRAFDYWKVLALTADQRRALAGELMAVIARYEAQPPAPGADLSIVHAAFAPKLKTV